ncbi:MAG: glycosyltransferase family 39 protein [bacterium]|nr:glycosyltransferase family 39 protein [bacterium]
MNIRNYIPLTIVLILMIIGIFLRTYEFEGFTTYLSDQGRDAIIVKNIATFQHWPAIGAPSSVGQVYLGPFYYYLIAPFLPLFMFNPVGLSYASLFYSIVGMALVYYVIRKDHGIIMALTTLFLMTFSVTLISFARFSWNPNLLPYFGFFTLYFFSKWLKEKNLISSLMFGSVFGLAIQLHYLAVFLGVPILLMYLLDLYGSKNKLKQLVGLVPALGGFLLCISPLILFDIRHNFINAKQLSKLITDGGLSSGQPYIARLTDTIIGLANHGLQIVANPSIVVGVVGILLIIVLWYAYRFKSQFILLHVLSVLTYMVGFAYLGNPRFAHYYGQIYISLFIIIAYVITMQKQAVVRYVGLAFMAILFLWFNIPRYHFFVQTPNHQISHAKTVAMELKKHIGDKPYNIATWPVDMGEDMYIYFLEIGNMGPADRTKLEITDQLFVLCSEEPCEVTDSPSWNISMFGPAHIVDKWEIENIQIYKLEHNTPDSL